MTIAVSVCILTTMTSIILGTIGKVINDNSCKFLSFILAFISFMGWAVFNTTSINKIEKEEIEISLAFTENTAVVEYFHDEEVLTKKYDSNDAIILKDYNCKWFLKKYFNHYNYEIKHKLEYEIDDKSKLKKENKNSIELKLK